MKRAAGLLLAVLAGCGEPGPSGVKNPDTYTYLSVADVDGLDPDWIYDTPSHAQLMNVYEDLVSLRGASTSGLEPELSEKVPSVENGLVSSDGLVYRFPIRKGVRFHDGSTLTPEDVRFSLMRFCLLDRDGGPSSLLLRPLTGFETTRKGAKPDPAVFAAVDKAVGVDGSDVVLTLKEPFPPLLFVLANWGMVLSKSWSAAHGDWDGTEADWPRVNNIKKESSAYYDKENGTGPFTLERWSRSEREVVLARFDGYWRGPAKLKRVVTKAVEEFGTRKLMLQAGDADAIYADRHDFPEVAHLPGVTIIDDLPTLEMSPIVFFMFKLDTQANPDVGSGKLDGRGIPADFFSDIDVRKGFAYAFDYDGFFRDVLRGKGLRADGPIPDAMEPGKGLYRFDPKQAEAHFRKAFGGRVWERGFKLTASYNEGNATRQELCQMLKRSLESLNPRFKVEVRGLQWPSFLAAMNAHKLPVFSLGWQGDYADPNAFASPLLRSDVHWAKVQGFSNPRLDALIDRGRRETDPVRRREVYEELETEAQEYAPQLWIANTVAYRTQRDWVHGYVHNPVFPGSPYSCDMYPVWKGP